MSSSPASRRVAEVIRQAVRRGGRAWRRRGWSGRASGAAGPHPRRCRPAGRGGADAGARAGCPARAGGSATAASMASQATSRSMARRFSMRHAASIRRPLLGLQRLRLRLQHGPPAGCGAPAAAPAAPAGRGASATAASVNGALAGCRSTDRSPKDEVCGSVAMRASTWVRTAWRKRSVAPFGSVPSRCDQPVSGSTRAASSACASRSLRHHVAAHRLQPGTQALVAGAALLGAEQPAGGAARSRCRTARALEGAVRGVEQVVALVEHVAGSARCCRRCRPSLPASSPARGWRPPAAPAGPGARCVRRSTWRNACRRRGCHSPRRSADGGDQPGAEQLGHSSPAGRRP